MTVQIVWDDSTNKDYLKHTLERVFDNTDGEAFVEYKNVFQDLKSDEYYVRYGRIGGFEQGGEIVDGANIPVSDPHKGIEIEFTQARFGQGFKITRMMKKFEKYNLFEGWTRKLNKTMWEMKDTVVAQLYNNPTSTTYGSGYDAKALLDGTHGLLDAGSTTYNNYVTVQLAVSSLQDGFIYFDEMLSDEAQPMPKKPDTLVIGTDLSFRAGQLLAPGGVPFEESNTKNMFPQFGLNLFTYHRLTDQDGWFLIKKNDEDFGPRVITSQDPALIVKDAPDTSRNTLVTSEQMFTYGYDDARLVYGSIPA